MVAEQDTFSFSSHKYRELNKLKISSQEQILQW